MSRPRTGRRRVLGLEFAWWRRLRDARRHDQADQAMTRTVLPRPADRQPDTAAVPAAARPFVRPAGALPGGDELRVRAYLRALQTRPFRRAPYPGLCLDRREVRDV